LGCYGYAAAATPRIDALATSSLRFERAYTAVPITLPSHATMLTGLLPPEHGLRINSVSRLPDDIPPLAKILQEQGYRTGAFISSLVLDQRFGLARGFDEYNDRLQNSLTGPRVERPAGDTVSATVAWLNSVAGEPLFCWVHLYDPHEPYDPHSDEFGERFASQPYDGELAYVDQQVGRLLDVLAQLDLNDRTLIILAGDHGEGLGEHGEATHGFLAYNSTRHVPLIIRPPAPARSHVPVSQPVSLVDISPTILSALDLPIPQGVSGRNLLPHNSAASTNARACYGESEAPYMEGGWCPLRTWTTEEWKLIQTTVPELYNLTADPGETHNLVQEQPDVAARLEQELDAFASELTVRKATATASTEAEIKALRTLGYAGGQPPAQASGVPLRDIKETLQFAEQVHHCMDLIDQRHSVEAQQLLEEVVAALPDYPKAWGTLGVCLAVQDKYTEAEPHYRRALRLDANQNFARIGLGRALFALGRLEECVDELQSAVKAEPSALDAQYYLGEACRRLQRWDQASTALTAAAALDPAFPEAQVALADLARDRGDLETASDRYRQVLTRNPRAIDAALSYSRVLQLLGRDGEALQTLDGLLSQSPKHVAALTEFATLLATTKNVALRESAKAVAAAEQACRLSGRRSIPPLRALATAEAAAGQFDAAIKAAEEALALAREEKSDSLVAGIERDIAAYREHSAIPRPAAK
ncbi:MAG: sulfatase-like hydrolase/transferase, partial [Planctomycetaceae bacterium]